MRLVQARLVRLQREHGSRGSKGERKEQMLSEEPRSAQRQGRKEQGGGKRWRGKGMGEGRPGQAGFLAHGRRLHVCLTCLKPVMPSHADKLPCRHVALQWRLHRLQGSELSAPSTPLSTPNNIYSLSSHRDLISHYLI